MLHKKHKDILVRTVAGIVTGAYIAYIIWLVATGNTDVTGQSNVRNYILIGLCLIVAIAFLINTLYRPLIQKRVRLILALVGVVLIILAHYTMTDSPDMLRYLGDLTKIFGVFMLIGGATGAVIPTDIIEEMRESKVEIIEA